MCPMEKLAKEAKEAAKNLLGFTEEQRQKALLSIAETLRESTDSILEANKKDINASQDLNSALKDRLLLTPERVEAMARSVESIAYQPAVVGEIVEEYRRPNGLLVRRERIPLGVIAMVFESRPNVVIDGAALAIKSGNAIILKGGKEAYYSNLILSQIVKKAIAPFLPENSVQLIETREEVAELLKLNQYIDLMIPRGGARLIQFVYDHATMPVVAHFAGLCHGYVHKDADLQKALSICLNAKVSRPGVCNAMETLLLHKELPHEFLKTLANQFLENKVELRGCSEFQKINPNILPATDADWDTEYLEKILSVKIVSSLEEAISHIQKHGTHHTEFICTTSPNVAEKFKNQIDASCIMINASSRFNDGGELGLGAEMGISTSKVHAYGPMGAREITTTRFIVEGDGQIR
ncbi:MAG: glutamate-5-semialdehyde dehydrogenase [Bdellovibrio sp.]|nr:MAG: glutamate-5-semialdehyde dehydrogenase [Bdellovibrio sp.]